MKRTVVMLRLTHWVFLGQLEVWKKNFNNNKKMFLSFNCCHNVIAFHWNKILSGREINQDSGNYNQRYSEARLWFIGKLRVSMCRLYPLALLTASFSLLHEEPRGGNIFLSNSWVVVLDPCAGQESQDFAFLGHSCLLLNVSHRKALLYWSLAEAQDKWQLI